ncbi:hypothetical protein ACSQ67_000478 [Phaseolus vulgaris]
MGLFVVFHSFFGFFGSLHKIHTICFCESFIKQMCSRGCFLEPLVRCFGKKPSFSVFCGDWFRVLMLSSMDRLKLKCKGFFCNIGCLGCCKKAPGIISMDEASKGLRTRELAVTKVDGPDGFWSSSTSELDHSAAHSQRSISSIGKSNNPSDPQSSGSSQSGPPEFVNHGKFAPIWLLLWNQIRQQWVGNKGSESIPEIQEPRISYNATSDTLLGNNKPFPQRIPLREMIDFLVDVWEQEGLYG